MQTYQPQKTLQAGFTLVELLVTTSLTVLLMLTITTLFMTFLVGNSKTNIRKSVKEEGLHALNQMEFNIKNARYVEGSCTENMTALSVVGIDGGVTVYSTVQDVVENQQNEQLVSKIASNNSRLTSEAVTLTALDFDCSGDPGNRLVKVSFILEKNAPTLNEDSTISEPFQATINMRN